MTKTAPDLVKYKVADSKIYVYFVQMGGTEGPIKIGYSESVRQRMGQLKTGSPFPLTLLATVEGSPRLEQELHAVFHKHWIAREWFNPDAELLEAVEFAKNSDLEGLVGYINDKIEVYRGKSIEFPAPDKGKAWKAYCQTHEYSAGNYKK